MKKLLTIAALAAGIFVCARGGNAQNCSNWSIWDLRGTYTMSGSGWIDLSKILPGVPNIPTGTMPMAWAGAVSYDGTGGGTGWVTLNAGGAMMNIELVNLTYQVRADCGVVMTYSMSLKELGVTIGPVSRLAVVSGNGTGLELAGIQIGGKPGDPVDLMIMRRISLLSK